MLHHHTLLDKFECDTARRKCDDKAIKAGCYSVMRSNPYTEIDPHLGGMTLGPSCLDPRRSDDSGICELDISEADVLQAIDLLKTSKVNLEGIPPWLIKKTGEMIAKPLSMVFGRSVQMGVYPHRLKLARVIPIHKGGSASVINYRPISIISIFAQIVEGIVAKRLYEYADAHILPNYQFGFRKGYSTTHATLDLIEQVTTNMEENQRVGALFLDIKNAFPSADHAILRFKLEHYGVRGQLLNWIGSFLRNRGMFVKIGDCSSCVMETSRGVPQGSPLGPLLFSVYLADFGRVVGQKCILFADDAVVLSSNPSSEEVVASLNGDLTNLQVYLSNNRLELNTSKSKWMLLGDSSAVHSTVVYGNALLERVETFRYLGFIIDTKLTWKPHVDTVISKIKQRLYLLRRSRYGVCKSGRLMLFNTLIAPYLTYGLEFWYITSQSYRGSLDVLHRYCLRVILNDVNHVPLLSNAEVYLNLDVLPLSLLFQLRVGMLMFKAVNLNNCPPVCDMLHRQRISQGNMYTNRNRNEFKLPLIKKEYCRTCLTFYGCKLWNEIPPHIRDSHTVRMFVENYRPHLIDQFLSIPQYLKHTSYKAYEYV